MASPSRFSNSEDMSPNAPPLPVAGGNAPTRVAETTESPGESNNRN